MHYFYIRNFGIPHDEQLSFVIPSHVRQAVWHETHCRSIGNYEFTPNSEDEHAVTQVVVKES